MPLRQEIQDPNTAAGAGVTAAQAPLVSVVIPTYNHAHFLGEAIASALTQTAGTPEVVVVDDGSADDPAAVVEQFPGVRLIRQPNQGLSAARNTGWRASRGRYVVFLDADDRLLREALSVNLASFARQPDCAVVFAAYRLVDSEGKPYGLPVTDGIGEDAYESFLQRNWIGMHATVMYRRECLEASGGFDTGLRACEDYDLYLRLARKHRIAWSREVVAEYRQHPRNMSKNNPLMLDTVLRVLRRQQPHLVDNARWRAAHADGLAYVKRLYVGLQLGLARELRPGGISGLARIFPLAPHFVLAGAWRAVAWRVRERLNLGKRRTVDFGGLRRTTPISAAFGYDRGKPVDRHYVEAFLTRHAEDIRGRVLEIGDCGYTRQFGGARVSCSDVLNVTEAPGATFVGDLADGSFLPTEAFDCVVLTQTLQFIFDVPRALTTVQRILKPGGVLLVTVPGVSSVDAAEEWRDIWYWSFTPVALRGLLTTCFHAEDVDVAGYGNVLTAAAFLYGLAEHELSGAEFAVSDPRYPVIVGGRAVKRGEEP